MDLNENRDSSVAALCQNDKDRTVFTEIHWFVLAFRRCALSETQFATQRVKAMTKPATLSF